VEADDPDVGEELVAPFGEGEVPRSPMTGSAALDRDDGAA